MDVDDEDEEMPEYGSEESDWINFIAVILVYARLFCTHCT
jgi:hypothetical protein